MNEENCVKIEILKRVPFFGEGDTIESRLRKISLKGFPDIKIYKNAKFEYEFFTPEMIVNKLHTPQIRVYRENLNRISSLQKLFLEKNINILNLDAAYDFIAISESGEKTEWTMLPPIVENFHIPQKNGKLNYLPIIEPALLELLKEKNLGLNKEIFEIEHTGNEGYFDLINDGSHRIHHGYENGGIKILKISNITLGYPYYAAPYKYDVVVYQTRDEALNEPETKIHIIDSPGHKELYRLFPTGGILSGVVRSEKKLEKSD